MKIFFNENYILLEDIKPFTADDNMIMEGIGMDDELGQWLQTFEKSSVKHNLCLYPLSADFDLKAAFVSLFRLIEAAGGIVKNEQGGFLFIYRWGKWDLPKGKLHKKSKETREDGAKREVMEETGLTDVSIIRELSPTWHVYYQDNQRILKRTSWFLMTAPSTSPLKPQKEEGIEVVKWVDPKDIGLVLENTYASLRELIEDVGRRT